MVCFSSSFCSAGNDKAPGKSKKAENEKTLLQDGGEGERERKDRDRFTVLGNESWKMKTKRTGKKSETTAEGQTEITLIICEFGWRVMLTESVCVLDRPL